MTYEAEKWFTMFSLCVLAMQLITLWQVLLGRDTGHPVSTLPAYFQNKGCSVLKPNHDMACSASSASGEWAYHPRTRFCVEVITMHGAGIC